MADSDHEEADMDKLELSSDFADIIMTKKRPREEDSAEDESNNLSTKKQRNFFDEQTEISKEDNTETISDKNGTDEYNVKEEKHTIYSESEQNVQEKFLSELNMHKEENKEKQDIKLIKQENGNEILLNKDCSITDENIGNIKKEDGPHKKPVTNTIAISISNDEEEGKESNEEINEADEQTKEQSKKNGIKKKHIAKNRIVDTEVVDGLELSVECASDKEEPSSESENEKETKPRPKTIIVKAEPNESELECSMSETEKSDSQEVTNTLEIKSEKKVKKRGSRISFSKLKASESEGSQNNNSDEDYSPRTKKRMKKSPMAKKTKHSVESKRGRGVKKHSSKKITEHISDDDSVTSTEKINKAKKTESETEEELSEKDSSANESNNNSENEKEFLKDRRTRRSNAEPDNNRQIQKLKKYIKVAGIKIRSYNDVWADCRNNSARINRLKELLEKNGISGRPTLEKCKRAKKKKERMQEVSELDISNIISEGRVTRARRNMNKSSTSPDTPQRYREARKRIHSIVDTDSE
ncbi:HIRA-interacting protein 3-like [Formica exsecta]|uniref:HIRA-interacting protein 3-like n=1 Tax=Formica exsecta TaxID=72781 RepID=UPI001143C093|nr:HIRA-interacting protein 3-like [Formica exsecta]